MNYIALYLLIINIFTFFLMFVDKVRAERSLRRVSEFSFAMLSLFGGGLGVVLGMGTFSHKTLKPLFNLMIPIWTLAEYTIIVSLYYLIGF